MKTQFAKEKGQVSILAFGAHTAIYGVGHMSTFVVEETCHKMEIRPTEEAMSGGRRGGDCFGSLVLMADRYDAAYVSYDAEKANGVANLGFIAGTSASVNTDGEPVIHVAIFSCAVQLEKFIFVGTLEIHE